MIVCAGENSSENISENIVGALPIGVGLLQSAINLTKLCLREPPKFIVFAGTAGSYGDHGVLEIVTSQSAANYELSFLQHQSYTPITNLITIESELLPHQTIVNSSNYITTDQPLGAEMLRRGAGLENMEFFAVMSVAQAFGIPAGGVFAVTNYTNAAAHSDFLANRHEAMRLLADYLARNFANG